MKSETTITYYLDVLGRLWMPNCHAATRRTVRVDTYEAQLYGEPLTDKNVADYPYGPAFGDFSSIVDVRVEKKTTRSAWSGDGACLRTRTIIKVLKEMSEENEMIFADCMEGEG